MDFHFDERHQAMRHELHDLLAQVCPPDYVATCDRTGDAPRAAFDALAQAGWLGVAAPEAFGGAGGNAIDLAILLETVGFHHGDLGLWIFRNHSHGIDAILNHGSAAMQAEIIPKVVRGEAHFAFSLTEPDAGSDAAAIRTKATKDGDEYRITGSKNFTSGMNVATHILVATRTDSSGGRHEGITNFVIPATREGIEWRRLSLLGHRTMGTSVVYYDSVAAPVAEVLGEVNDGWAGLMSALTTERLCVSAVRTGAAAAALALARAHVDEQSQRYATARKPGVRQTLTEMHMLVEAARLRLYRFAWLVAREQASRLDTAALKVESSETYVRVADLGMRVLDGHASGSAMERHFRDSGIGTIGAGANEIQRNVIAKAIGL